MTETGTGKTTNLTRQIRRAVERFGPDSVLITSFSRAAAAELAGRDLPVEPDRVGTLHSHCYHALGGPQIAEANVDEWNKDNPHLHITPVKKQGKLDGEETVEDDGESEKDGDKWLQELGRYRGQMLPPGAWSPALRQFAAKWQAYKDAKGLLDFCDLIERCLLDLRVAPKMPSVIFADEAHLNRMQLTLIRQWGRHTDYFIVAGDDDQCQPPGTMVRTNEGDVSIEELDPERHTLVSYAAEDGCIYGNRRGFRFKKVCREYDYRMLTVRAGQMATRCTPEHEFYVRWVKGELLNRTHVVYLMQRGDRVRVGWCKLIRSDGVFHLGHRARLERAEAAWILRVCYGRTEASIYESYIAAKYGLPLATFEPVNGAQHYSRESLDALFELLKPERLPIRAAYCLLDHSRDPRFPIYTPARAAAKRGGSTQFLTEAANMVPDVMAVPVVDRGGVIWEPISLSEERYCGPIYSLDVDVHHTYIADGIITHNCIYSFTGASPDAILGPEIPEDHKIILKQSYRVPRAVHAAANNLIHQVTRRQAKDYLPRAADGTCSYLSGTWQTPEYAILRTTMEHLERGRTVMFLVACSYMLRPIIQILRKNAIPFHNPYRRSNGFWNPLRIGRRGSTVNRILALLVAHPGFGEGHREWTAGDFALWAEWLIAKRIFKHGAKSHLRNREASQIITIADLDAVFETAALESLLACFEGDHRALLTWWHGRVNGAMQNRIQFPTDIAAARGPHALLERPQVIVGTIHSVKGGEADVVILFPDLSQAGDAAYQRYGPPRDAVIRTFYVGMTRAREALYLADRTSTMAAYLTA